MGHRSTSRDFFLRAVAAGVVCACLPLCRPLLAADAPASPVLAEVDGTAVTLADLDQELAAEGRPPASQLAPEEVRVQLVRLVRNRALAAAARAAGYERRPEVQGAITRLFAARYRDELLEPRLAALTVSDEEVERHYRENPDDFRLRRRVRGAVVRIAVSPKAADQVRQAARAKAEAALAEARALPPGTPAFGAVAVKHSDDQATRYRGGETGWLTDRQEEARWPAPVVAALFSLKAAGEFGPVVEAEDGFYLVKIVEEKPVSLRPLPEVRDILQRKLLFQKREALAAEFYAQAEKAARVVVHEEAVLSAAGASGADAAKAGPPPLPGR